MQKLYNILSWIFGVGCLIAIFTPLEMKSVSASSAILISICYLLIAMLFLPPVREFVFEKTSKTLKTSQRILLTIVLMIFVVILTPKEDRVSKKAIENDITENIDKAEPEKKITVAKEIEETVIKVSAKNIIAEYEANEVSADNKYKDKKIEITGRIAEIKKTIWDTLYVEIGNGDQYSFRNAQAYFSDENNDILANLKKGQNITVICTGGGLIINVQLEDCSIKK